MIADASPADTAAAKERVHAGWSRREKQHPYWTPGQPEKSMLLNKTNAPDVDYLYHFNAKTISRGILSISRHALFVRYWSREMAGFV
jgi:hypothetical protein